MLEAAASGSLILSQPASSGAGWLLGAPMMGATKERGRAAFVALIAGTECLEKATDITEETPMRRTIVLALAAMLASSMAFAQT